MVLMAKIVIVPSIMKSFTVLRTFTILISWLPHSCLKSVGQALIFPIVKMRKLKLYDFKQHSQHQLNNRWCSLNWLLGYWFQIDNISPNCTKLNVMSKHVTVSFSCSPSSFSSFTWCPSPPLPLLFTLHPHQPFPSPSPPPFPLSAFQNILPWKEGICNSGKRV